MVELEIGGGFEGAGDVGQGVDYAVVEDGGRRVRVDYYVGGECRVGKGG